MRPNVEVFKANSESYVPCGVRRQAMRSVQTSGFSPIFWDYSGLETWVNVFIYTAWTERYTVKLDHPRLICMGISKSRIQWLCPSCFRGHALPCTAFCFCQMKKRIVWLRDSKQWWAEPGIETTHRAADEIVVESATNRPEFRKKGYGTMSSWLPCTAWLSPLMTSWLIWNLTLVSKSNQHLRCLQEYRHLLIVMAHPLVRPLNNDPFNIRKLYFPNRTMAIHRHWRRSSK